MTIPIAIYESKLVALPVSSMMQGERLNDIESTLPNPGMDRLKVNGTASCHSPLDHCPIHDSSTARNISS